MGFKGASSYVEITNDYLLTGIVEQIPKILLYSILGETVSNGQNADNPVIEVIVTRIVSTRIVSTRIVSAGVVGPGIVSAGVVGAGISLFLFVLLLGRFGLAAGRNGQSAAKQHNKNFFNHNNICIWRMNSFP